jgi:NAD+ diphosphatase
MRPDADAFAFVRDPLDRAEHLREDGGALDRLWHDGRVLQLDASGRAPMAADGRLRAEPGSSVGGGREGAVFLGLRGGQGWFARPLEDEDEDDGRPRVDLRTAAATWPCADATCFAQARAVLHWRARHRHCGACGTMLAFSRAGWLGRCARCGIEHYPRTDPAVIVAVSDGERLLLGRQAQWASGLYSVLAGFVEPGESLEQTVVREVFEESGIRVRTCRYLASQPWPFPSSLMLGFSAEADPDEPVVGDELEDARWVARDEVGAALRGEDATTGLRLSPPVSISRWLIERWYGGGNAPR